MGIGTISFDNSSKNQPKIDKKKLKSKRKSWYTQAERVIPDNPDQYVPRDPLIESTPAEDIGEIIRVTFSRTTKGRYAPFITHRNPDGSYDKTPIPKPANFDITEAFYVISAYYAGMPLKQLPGQEVPLCLLSTGKWRLDIDLMIKELESAADGSSDWLIPKPMMSSNSVEKNIEDLDKDLENLTETIDEAKESINYALLAMKSVASPEDVIDEYDKIKVGALSEDVDIRENAFGALACLADEYPERIADDLQLLFNGLEDDEPAIRRNALHALGNIAQSRPNEVATGREAIREQINHDNQKVSIYAIEVLLLISGASADAEEWIDRLESVISDPVDNIVLSTAIRTASLLAESAPTTASQLIDETTEHLDHEDEEVREHACMFFQFVGTESVEQMLQERLDDSNPDVQRAASEALNVGINK